MQCGKIVLQEAQRVLQKVTYSCCRHAQQGICDGRVSVRPSVRLVSCQQQRRAVGLLLSAGALARAADIDRQLRARRTSYRSTCATWTTRVEQFTCGTAFK